MQQTENEPKPLCMRSLNAGCAARIKKLRQSLVPEASYHAPTVTCNASGVNPGNGRTISASPLHKRTPYWSTPGSAVGCRT